MPEDRRIVVLVDAEAEDRRAITSRLEEIHRAAGLTTKTAPGDDGRFHVINRVAIEELEAWFFGDVAALCEAFPGVPRALDRQAPYREPDHTRGGTWEALERVLQQAGYYPGGLAKVDAARKVSGHMDPERNRSASFQVFRAAVLEAFAGNHAG